MNQNLEHFLRKTADVLLKVIHFLLAVDMGVMFVLMILQIVLRSFFTTSIRWSDELLRYMFMWMVFLGLPSAIYNDELTRFDLLEQKLPPNLSRWIRVIVDILCTVVLCVVMAGCFKLVPKQLNRMATTFKVPMGYIYSVLPFAGAIAIIFLLINIILRVSKNTALNKKEETAL